MITNAQKYNLFLMIHRNFYFIKEIHAGIKKDERPNKV